MSDERERGAWPERELPESWCWAKFDEILVNVTSSSKKLKQKQYAVEGKYRVIDQGQEDTGGYTDDESLLHPEDPPLVVFGDHTRCVKYVDHRFVQGADGVKVLKPLAGLDSRYLYHAMRTVILPDKGYSRHFKYLRATEFPLAPLNEQRRIVAKIEALQERSQIARAALEAIPPLLEKFRQSVLAAAYRGDLTSDWRKRNPRVVPAKSLVSEPSPKPSRFKSRSKSIQPGDYALSVGNPELQVPEGWDWVLLAEIARLETGHTPSRKHPEYWGGDVPWLSIPDAREHHAQAIPDTSQHTNELGLANSAARLLPKDTVCLSRTASVGYVTVMGQPMATSQDFVNWVCTLASRP